jgi:hypothetical protein
MAYQFGVLAAIVVWSSVFLSFIVVAVLRGDIEAILGLVAAIGLVWWYSDLRAPQGFWGRILLLLRDGVPLAPYGFRNDATLGYWLGIPIIYVGHAITAVTLFIGWQLSKQPTAGVPLGIGIGFAMVAYSTGIGLVESSYRLWAKRLNGVIPGDAGSSPARSVVVSIAVLTTLIAGSFLASYSPQPDNRNSSSAEQQQAADERHPIATASVTLTDFIAVTFPGWTGEAIIRYDDANIVKRIPATMTGNMFGGNTVALTIELEGASTEVQLVLSDSGRQLNGLAVIERSEIAGGALRIVVSGYSDDVAREFVRVIITVKDDIFELKNYVEQANGSFLLRDEFRFRRMAN